MRSKMLNSLSLPFEPHSNPSRLPPKLPQKPLLSLLCGIRTFFEPFDFSSNLPTKRSAGLFLLSRRDDRKWAVQKALSRFLQTPASNFRWLKQSKLIPNYNSENLNPACS